MRLLTLLLGLAVAGLLIVLPQQFNVNIQPAFVKLWPNTDAQRQLANIIFFAIPLAAVLGGLLALLVPGISALLLLLAGLGWFGILLSIPHGFSLMGAAPGAVAVLGAVTAYVAAEIAASRRREGLREERATRRSRRLRDYDDGDDATDYAPPRQVEPSLADKGRAEPQVERMTSSRPKRPRYEIPLTLEDAARDEDDEVEVDVVAPRRGVVEPPIASRAVSSGRRGQDRAAARAPERDIAVSRRVVDEDEDYDEYGRPIEKRRFPWTAVMAGIVLLALAGIGGWFYLERSPLPGTQVAAASPATVTSSANAGSSAAATTAAAGGFGDPFAYCKAVGTIDYVDARYTGDLVTPEIAQALRMPLDSSRDRVTWRCVEGQVLGCSSFAWPRCGMVPTAKELVEFCRLFPDVPRLIAPQGPWSCKEGKPQLPDNASWPVDARGFAVGAWINISASVASTSATPVTNAPASAAAPSTGGASTLTTLPSPEPGTTIVQ